MIEITQQLFNIDLKQNLIFIIILMIFIKTAWELCDWFANKIGISTKKSREQDMTIHAIKEYESKLLNMEQNLELLKVASKESLLYKINEKYNKYFLLGYIPLEEYDEFVSLHDAYKGIGGNHTGDEKFNKVIKSLEVKNMYEQKIK